MVAAGLPLWRVGVLVAPCIPIFTAAISVLEAVPSRGSLGGRFQDSGGSPRFYFQSGISRVPAGAGVRARMYDPASSRFPIVDDLRGEGASPTTSRCPLPFISDARSMAIDAGAPNIQTPCGFTD